MDAVGQLASGISHDFNNILSGIINSAQLLKMTQHNIDEKGKNYINVILKSSSHAESLISKLLTFSNNKMEEEHSVDIHSMIIDTHLLLRETIDKSVTIITDLKAENFNVFGSISSLHSTILNISINANHAMVGGGKLTISTKNVKLTQNQCNRKDFILEPGEYIQILISDNGIGMTKEVLNRIFEPFYTTKSITNGSGLGLAAVYTTIKNHKGSIDVESTYGYGTTFKNFTTSTL